MAKIRTLQLYRGTEAQNNAYTGSIGELTMDTTLNELRVHDGITPGGHKIGGGYHPDLFTWQWADHELNDVQWLRADTFSWQSGAVYQAAYQHLASDISGKSLTSETVAGVTVQFYLADDGHKICPASQESNVTAIYNATGVAWYYILDTANQRFKLPRTQFGVTGLRDTVGNYVAAGLPNITGGVDGAMSGQGTFRSATGAFKLSNGPKQYGIGKASAESSNNNYEHANIDASESNSIYGNSTTVQPPATQMYLYFYVGNFTQTALENTAGLNTELFNGKADLNLSNTASNIDFVVESQVPTAANNYTWYRKYKSGWVEQGGWRNNYGGTITFPIAMSLTNQYTAILVHNGDTSKGEGFVHCYNKTSTSMSYGLSSSTSGMAYVSWQVSGMAAN